MGVSITTLRRLERAGRLKVIRLSPRIIRIEEAEIWRLIHETSLENTKSDGGDAA
jgi:predicted site-specific integrase-resolvase